MTHNAGGPQITTVNPAPTMDSDEQSTLILRADASVDAGVGHVMRCLALAKAWQQRGGKAVFISFCSSNDLGHRIEAAGVEFLPLDSPYPNRSDLDFTLRVAERTRASWLALDGYHYCPDYQESIRGSGIRLLVMDDTAHLPSYHADIMLNQNYDAQASNYNCDADTVQLLGTSYALLRPEFLSWLRRQRDIPQVAKKVLITLGGSDPKNVTRKVIEAMELVEISGLKMTVVVGPANPNLETLYRSMESNSTNSRILTDVINMPGLMAWADVAISAAGSTCWELLFMGLPTSLIEVADNQHGNAEGLGTAGLVMNLGRGDEVAAAQIAESITQLCRNPGRRSRLSQEGRALVDGAGVERVVTIMQALSRGLPRDWVKLRYATEDDAHQLWRLANHPTVRKQAISPEPIPLDAHIDWYKRKLSSSNSRIWVMELAGTVIAQARYDRASMDTAEVDYAVAPAFRRRGFGTRILGDTWRQACIQLMVKEVRGVVLESNEASARTFIKSGFSEIGEDRIAGRHCHIFQRECR